MQWAEGGSLDDLIDTRLGRPTHLPAFPPSSPTSPSSPAPSSPSPASPDHQSPQGEHHHTTEHRHQHSRSARIRAFRALQRAPPEDKARLREKLGLGAGSAGTGAGGGGAGGTGAGAWKAVHLFSAEEVRGLFSDVVEGLAFLVRVCSFFLSLRWLGRAVCCALGLGLGASRSQKLTMIIIVFICIIVIVIVTMRERMCGTRGGTWGRGYSTTSRSSISISSRGTSS